MDMVTLPRAKCPYCLQVLPTWHGKRMLGLCGHCERPIALVPAILRPGAHRLWNVYSTLYVVTLPIIAGALVSTAIGDLPPRELVIVVAIMLLLWGAADLWDGCAGYRTKISRAGKIVHQGDGAKRRSILKALAGIVALCLGLVGLLI